MSYVYNPWAQPDTVIHHSSDYYAPNASSTSSYNAHHAQPLPVSTYSSLSGALDPAAGAGVNRSYIYKSAPARRNSSSSAYPYPVVSAGPRSPGYSGSQASNIYSSQNGGPTRNARGHHPVQHDLDHQNRESSHPVHHLSLRSDPPGPTNHIRIPQKKFREPLSSQPSYHDSKHRLPHISFQMANFPELGVRVGTILGRNSPAVVDGKERVLGVGDREIKIRILWPGYSSEPFEKRMKTHHGAVPRDTILLVLARAIIEFTTYIQKENIPAERGYEAWAVGTLPNGRNGIMGPELFITGLFHRGGSNWQPEIWAPNTQL